MKNKKKQLIKRFRNFHRKCKVIQLAIVQPSHGFLV